MFSEIALFVLAEMITFAMLITFPKMVLFMSGRLAGP